MHRDIVFVVFSAWCQRRLRFKMISLRIFEKYQRHYNVFKTKLFSKYVRNDLSCCLSYNSSNVNDRKTPSLYDHLYSKILACGPITVSDYMKEVLTHPTVGYYMHKDVFGKQGDFITSPEISQIFGEMIAVWIKYEWEKLSKDPFQLVELGPGRGTLINDILRVFKQFKLLNKVSAVHLVEISPALSKIQANKLCKTIKEHDVTKLNRANACYREGVTEDGVKLYWYYSIKDVPKAFSIVLAHEFFDALPIHKFQRTDKGWCEVLVDIIQGSKEEKFRYVLSNGPTPATYYVSEDEKREHVEISPESLVTVDYIAGLLWEYGGFAFICDYGHNGDKTDTFRGFSQHMVHDPLLNPGKADLTADVDFAALSKIAKTNDRVIIFGPVTQAMFLRNLGINLRLSMLLQNVTTEKERKHLESGYHMIMDEDKMGTRFKILAMFPSILKEYLEKLPVSGFFR